MYDHFYTGSPATCFHTHKGISDVSHLLSTSCGANNIILTSTPGLATSIERQVCKNDPVQVTNRNGDPSPMLVAADRTAQIATIACQSSNRYYRPVFAFLRSDGNLVVTFCVANLTMSLTMRQTIRYPRLC